MPPMTENFYIPPTRHLWQVASKMVTSDPNSVYNLLYSLALTYGLDLATHIYTEAQRKCWDVTFKLCKEMTVWVLSVGVYSLRLSHWRKPAAMSWSNLMERSKWQRTTQLPGGMEALSPTAHRNKGPSHWIWMEIIPDLYLQTRSQPLTAAWLQP